MWIGKSSSAVEGQTDAGRPCSNGNNRIRGAFRGRVTGDEQVVVIPD